MFYWLRPTNASSNQFVWQRSWVSQPLRNDPRWTWFAHAPNTRNMYVRCLLRVPDVSEKPLLAACNALQPLQVEPSHVTPIASYQKANLKMACCHVPVSVGQRLRYMRHPSFIHARAVLLHMAPFSCAHQTGGRNQCDTCGAHPVPSSFYMWHGLPYRYRYK